MEGKELRAGAVVGLEKVRNPIRAAKLVMNTPHVIMTDLGVRRIAEAHNLPPLQEPGTKYVRMLENIKKDQEEHAGIYEKYYSTVGAVSLDKFGNLASGSSTGGTTSMLPGRVGDTPVLGAGIYADNTLGAVSCTGTGEYILRLSLAKEICVNLGRMSPEPAVQYSLGRMRELGGEAGVIFVKKKGQSLIAHTTEEMPAGYISEKGVIIKTQFKRI